LPGKGPTGAMGPPPGPPPPADLRAVVRRAAGAGARGDQEGPLLLKKGGGPPRSPSGLRGDHRALRAFFRGCLIFPGGRGDLGKIRRFKAVAAQGGPFSPKNAIRCVQQGGTLSLWESAGGRRFCPGKNGPIIPRGQGVTKPGPLRSTGPWGISPTGTGRIKNIGGLWALDQSFRRQQKFHGWMGFWAISGELILEFVKRGAPAIRVWAGSPVLGGRPSGGAFRARGNTNAAFMGMAPLQRLGGPDLGQNKRGPRGPNLNHTMGNDGPK